MKTLQWFRLYHRIIDDEKIRLLAFEDRWHFIAVCCLKADGLLDEPDSDLKWRKIAVKLGVQLRELDEIKRRLSEVGLVDQDLQPTAWDALQYKTDSSTERVRRYREKLKKNKGETQGNVSVTAQEAETDTDTSLRSVGARDLFDEFAGAYPKPLGRDRAKARQEFDTLSSEQQQRVIQATRLFAMDRASDRERRGETVEQAQRFTPNASRWLFERGWEAFDSAAAQPLVVIRPEQPEWALIEKMRGQKLFSGGRGTATVLQSEIEAARAAERQIA